MPRYFFHLSDGRRTYPDPVGVDLDSLEAARQYAHQDARSLLESWMARSSAPWRMIVVDESGSTVLSLALHEAAVSEANPLFSSQDDLAA
jgi:hypothetical protein